jgi:hypothetical protein
LSAQRIGPKFQLPLALVDPEAAKDEKPSKRGWNLQVGDKRSRGGASLGKGKQSGALEAILYAARVTSLAALLDRGSDETVDIVCVPPSDGEIETQRAHIPVG